MQIFPQNPVDPTDVLQKSKTNAVTYVRSQGDLAQLQAISAAILAIQHRLRPKRSLPFHLKQRFFFLRFAWVESVILRVYHMVTKEQKEIAYQLTIVCQDLVNANFALQEKVSALAREKLQG